MRRQFNAEAPNQVWVSDVTEHPTHGGKIYLAVVLDAHHWQTRDELASAIFD